MRREPRMSIEDIKQSELTAGERDVLTKDAERWKDMGSVDSGHLDDWLAYYPGLAIRRRLAMRVAFVNEPKGKGYVQAIGQLMLADGLDTKRDKTGTAFSAVLWLNDDPERIRILREIREKMSPGERSRLNSPISARQRVEKVLAAREAGTEENKRSKNATLKQQLAEKDREIAQLKKQVAAAEEAYSPFDLKRDSADDIVNAMIGNITVHKAQEISKKLAVAAKAKKAPAG